MNLQPLYDLRERLQYAAIAGTGLMEEDFRLKRAQEALAPLAAASPVFARISAGVQTLLDAPAEQRGGALLDVLALVDAVAYTQGCVGIGGAIEPLPAGAGRCCPASYGQLHPLLEALTGTGGGRMAVIQEAWENSPEWFGDYRVLPALVRGLGESYAELAELNMEILKAQGTAVLPLLKAGFDPAGKKEMVRRVRLIDELAGAAENAFYLDQLPEAKKEVRAALIFALRHDSANGETLTALCRTEKKTAREMALWALVRSDTPEAAAYLDELAEKDPDQALIYLEGAETELASRLTARLFLREMEELRANPKQPLTQAHWERLNRLRLALPGKTGADVCEGYRQAAALETALDRPMEGEKKEVMSFRCYLNGVNSAQTPFSEMLPLTLGRALERKPDPALCALAGELCDRYGGWWTVPALLGALLTQDAETAYRQAEKRLRRSLVSKLFGGKNGGQILKYLMSALLPDGGCEAYAIYENDPATKSLPSLSRHQRRPLAEALHPGWFDLMMEYGLDHEIICLLRPNDAALCEKLGQYLYRRVTHGGTQPLRRYSFGLCQCGWTDWSDFLVKYAEKANEIAFYDILGFLNEMPVPDREKAAQLKKLDQLVWSHRVKVRGGRWPSDIIGQRIAEWEGAPAEGGN